MKRCSTCKTEKAFDAFNKGTGKGGLQNQCRECQRNWQFTRNFQANPGKHRKKTCKECGKEKSLRSFYFTESNADKRVNRCKPCYRKASSEYYELKYEIVNERRKLARVFA